MRIVSRAVILACVMVFACVAGAADAPQMPVMPDSTPPGKPHFDSMGVQVGEQLPNLPLYDLSDANTSTPQYDQLWGPALIITSSYTCPKSRSMYPLAAALAGKFQKNVRTYVVYVIEAHPNGDPSPYSGYEDVTNENQRDHILCAQPRTIQERLDLARQFQKRLDVKVPILVDGMDNAYWKSLGGGPNMAFLVDENEIVLARQGWFDAKSMEAAAEVLQAALPKRDLQSENVMLDFDTIRPTEQDALDQVKAQLEKSPELATKVLPYIPQGDLGGRTLLHYAVERKHLDIVQFLVEKGADVNLQTEHAPTPLHLAAKAGDVAMAKFLIDHGAKINTRTQTYGPTPLQEALIYSSKDIADLLIKSGATSNFFTDVAMGNLDAVKKQLDLDPTIAVRPDGWHRPPLAYAAAAGQTKVVEALLRTGAHDEPPGFYRGDRSGIDWAVHNKNITMIRQLCQAGGTPNLINEAIDVDSLDAMRELLAQKADPGDPDIRGYRPLHNAAMLDKVEMMRVLLAQPVLTPTR